jgi:hypothetical protein
MFEPFSQLIAVFAGSLVVLQVVWICVESITDQFYD